LHHSVLKHQIQDYKFQANFKNKILKIKLKGKQMSVISVLNLKFEF